MARPRRAETIQGAGREATGVAKAPPGDPGRQPRNPGAPYPVTRPDAGEGRRGSRRRHPEPTAAAAACPADAATTTNAAEMPGQNRGCPQPAPPGCWAGRAETSAQAQKKGGIYRRRCRTGTLHGATLREAGARPLGTCSGRETPGGLGGPQRPHVRGGWQGANICAGR